MRKKVFLQAGEQLEERLAKRYFYSKGYEVVTLGVKKFTNLNRSFDYTRGDIAVGCVPYIKAALKRSGISMPLANPYPKGSEDFWNREISSYSREDLAIDSKIFLKEGLLHKEGFTGIVSQIPIEFTRSKTSIWYTSEIVKMEDHCRIYYVDKKVRFIAGDESKPSETYINDFISRLQGMPHHGSFDMALIQGLWSLVEFNDGFSIGAYNDVPFEIYGEMIEKRWWEIIDC